MNPTLIEYFAAHETLQDPAYFSIAQAECLTGHKRPDADQHMAMLEWDAKWRAKLRFIRAKAMAEEAERIRKEHESSLPTFAEVQAIMAASRPAPKTTNLSFSEALEAMKAGKRVKRKDWTMGHAELGPVTIIHATATGFTEYALKDVGTDNAQANDWQIVEEA